jgi:hypothetical protein
MYLSYRIWIAGVESVTSGPVLTVPACLESAYPAGILCVDAHEGPSDRWCAGCNLVVAPAMSAPAIHPSSSSISSSGQADGLGRRVLAFDREGGGMLERLHLRPELAAFEIALRGYVDRLTALEDERFARPLAIERDAATGELTVVSPFISGTRLSDLLDLAQDAGVAPGVDVALGYLLEALPAISTFHAKTGMAHGLIDPARTVVSPAGQIVFLDCAYGAAIERLGLSPTRMWTELGIAAPPSSGHVRLDSTADLAQIAMTAVMLVHGRRLARHEYPDALPPILMEIVEVAQIRRSSTFASVLQRILQRSLPLPGRRAFKSADEAIVEVRQLVRREIGLDVCRQALLEFVAQMDAASLADTPQDAGDAEDEAPDFDTLMADAGIQLVAEEGEESESGRAAIEEPAEEDASEFELELRLDGGTSEPAFVPAARNRDDEAEAGPEVIEIDDLFDIDGTSDVIRPPFSTLGPPPRTRSADPPPRLAPDGLPAGEPEYVPEPERLDPLLSYAGTAYESEPESALEAQPYRAPDDGPVVDDAAPLAAAPVLAEPPPAPVPEPAREPARTEAAVAPAAPTPAPSEAEVAPAAGVPASAADAPAAEPLQGPPPAAAPAPVAAPPLEQRLVAFPAPASAPPAGDSEHASDQGSETAGDEAAESTQAPSRRKKRQQRSARARKDKLRSVTTDQQIAGAKPAAPPTPKPTGWIVSPDRAASFEPPVQEAPVATPVVARPLLVPPAPTFPPPPPVVPPVVPAAGTPAVPVFPAPPPVQLPPTPIVPAPAPAAPAITASRATVQPAHGPVRLKADPPAGYTPVRKRLAPDPPVEERAYSPVPFSSMTENDTTRTFPWKLAGAAVVLIAIAVIVGRSYIPSRSGPDEAVEAAGVPAIEEPPAVTTPAGTTSGEIVIETQPAGARVLLNGRPVGESPLKIPSVTPGRHVITFVTSAGEFKRTVRVTAGQTLNLDVPLYSGWVAIFAPIILDVAENGRVIGNTEQNRLMLPPGPHKLTISNRELGYSSVKDVEVQAGEVYSVTLDPRGPVNFNAVPWGEVWLDNQKLGDTPIANFQVPLGVREFVFKHPQFGERRVTATVRANAPTAVSVDFTRP